MSRWIKNIVENYIILAAMPLLFMLWLIYLFAKNFWNLIYILLGISNFYKMLFEKETANDRNAY